MSPREAFFRSRLGKAMSRGAIYVRGGIGVRLTLCTLLSFSAVVGPAIVQA